MKLRRDPRDRRYGERLAGSYLVSLLFHLLLAVLLFSIATTSSQEGASESSPGGSLVTLEQRVPAVAVNPAPAQQAAPEPHAPVIAPVRHATPTRPKTLPQPPRKPELAKIVPSAPPQATPLPQASAQPKTEPTTPVYDTVPQTALPAVPTSVPTAVAVAVAVKMPPTAAPSPVPSAAPTQRPSPRPPQPTSAPTAKPQTPAPVASASAKPTLAPVAVARASAIPSASPAAAPVATAAPAKTPGAPSPSPTKGTATAPTTTGTAATPGPKGKGSPGPRPGAGGPPRPGTPRPLTAPPTPSPAPPAKGGASGPPDINAKLRSLLPTGPVAPTSKSYHPQLGLGSMKPTPPPEVVAATKFIYQGSGSGDEVTMWVTATHREGPLLICEGWMLRFPPNAEPTPMVGTGAHPVAGGVQVGTTVGGGAPRGGTVAPIIEEHASISCTQRQLTPFAQPSP
jgi:hypothetical protein